MSFRSGINYKNKNNIIVKTNLLLIEGGLYPLGTKMSKLSTRGSNIIIAHS